MGKPKPKPRKDKPYDYNHRRKPANKLGKSQAELLAAEYAELRTRSPGNRG